MADETKLSVKAPLTTRLGKEAWLLWCRRAGVMKHRLARRTKRDKRKAIKDALKEY